MRPGLVVVSALLVVVVVGLTGVFPGGNGQAPDFAGVERPPTETPTAPGDSSGGDGVSGAASAGTTPEPPTPPFGFDVDSVEPCGWTCRDITATLTNQQERTATDVTVSTRIYVGRGTDGNVAWEGTEAVGSLDAGASHTVTRRIELSYGEGLAVQRNGGWVTVRTTVRTAERTATVTEQRRVG